ncbi:MAG: helix-turn-helix transcriptional regulator [Lachnospiraceae bacterium]|nr:helix-turn-helix transcriptional regulator [Lachnospiraceae bacterium]
MQESNELNALKHNILGLMSRDGISMRELSLALDTSSSYIQKIMEGKYAPSMNKLFDIANYFHVPVASLFIEKNSLIQEIDTYLVYLDKCHLEIVLSLTKQLISTTNPKGHEAK